MSLEQAETELEGIASRLAAVYPETNEGISARLEPMMQFFRGGFTDMLILLMGATSIVLLLACLNVATLLLARAALRSREMAIRAAVGATRWRLVRQLFIESFLLAVAAGGGAFLLTQAGVILFTRYVANSYIEGPTPFWTDGLSRGSVDPAVLLFLAAISVVTPVVFGLAPALHVSRTDVGEPLRDGGRGGSTSLRVRRWTGALTIVQLALTLITLAAAGMLTRSFLSVYQAAMVLDTTGLVTMRVALPTQTYRTPEQRKQFHQQLNERLAANPVFSSVTVASDIPLMTMVGGVRQLELQSRPLGTGESPPIVSYLFIGPRYFETLRLPILRGRSLTEEDGRVGQEGAVVNQRFVSMFFGNENPLGQQIRLTNAAAPAGTPVPWVTIVGVSPTVPQYFAGQEPEPVVYGSLGGEPAPHRFVSMIARGNGDGGSLIGEMRKELERVDPDLPGYYATTFNQILGMGYFQFQLFGMVFGLLAGVALILTSVGLFAVTAHGVVQRTKELGVRMALGARSTQVVWLVMRRTLTHIALGLGIGLMGVAAVSNIVPAMLVRTSPTDPVTLSVAATILIATAVIAALLPARRATRIDPLESLRAD